MKRICPLLACSLGIAVACGGGSTAPAGTSTASYALTSVNGKPLPITTDSFLVSGGAAVTQLLSEELYTDINASVPNEISITEIAIQRTSRPFASVTADTVRTSNTARLEGSTFQMSDGSSGVIANNAITITSGAAIYFFARGT